MAEPCIFCKPQREVLAENAHALAVPDTYPVSPGHALVIPKRHAVTIWDLSDEEYAACFDLVRAARRVIEARHKPEAFNVGVNCGVTAGQSVMHLFDDDGRVFFLHLGRGVVKANGKYWKAGRTTADEWVRFGTDLIAADAVSL